MPKTIVKCSVPECEDPAKRKIAAPWSDGHFSELKTYTYACLGHIHPMLQYARERPKSQYLASGEVVGDIDIFPLAGV